MSFFFKVNSCDCTTAIFNIRQVAKKNAILESTSDHNLTSATVVTVGLIFVKFDIEVLDKKKKLECECELRKNRRSISHILPACINEF